MRSFTVVFQIRDEEAFKPMKETTGVLMDAFDDPEAPYFISAVSHSDEMTKLDRICAALDECEDMHEMKSRVEEILSK